MGRILIADGTRSLKDAVPEVEALKKRVKEWPPVQGTNEKTPKETLQNVVDEELGFID